MIAVASTAVAARTMDIIFRKTAKGAQEIATRTFGLPPRARSALILVDGQRSATTLRQLVGELCDEHLRTLHAQGFIEPAGQAPPAVPAAPPRVPTGAGLASPPRQAPAAPVPQFASARREAVRDFVDQVGPLGEVLAIRMERAQSAEELATLLDTAAKIVANVRGTGAAQAYLQRHRPG